MKGLNHLLIFSVMLVFLFVACSGGGSKSSSDGSQNDDPGNEAEDMLDFSDYTYTTQSVTVNSVTVSYHLYQDVIYVSDPVDYKYESMNVFVPVSIGGTDIDASDASMLMELNVGGYTSSSMYGKSSLGTNGKNALAAGFIVVTPGCRGRDNYSASLGYYGKAPAAIVDLKAAVRYIRHNEGVIPGNVDKIVSTGSSAGGALSALLGASGNSNLYGDYLDEIGAADADDNIYASACYCPITDLDHADMSYEWEFGSLISSADSTYSYSQGLQALFPDYQEALDLTGQNAFGAITADNLDDYILDYYLIPSAEEYLSGLSASALSSYQSSRTWITYGGSTGAVTALFAFADYLSYVNRSKACPAFDKTDLSSAENILFGNETTNARHFTDYAVQYSEGNPSATVGQDVQAAVNMMNPMYFIGNGNSGCAPYWFIRHGIKDSDTSLAVITDLSLALENYSSVVKGVDTCFYWDAGHGVNNDPDVFIEWLQDVTGYSI